MVEILAIDDDPASLDVLEATLQGHKLVTVASAEEALEVLATFHPDLILVDIGLPGMDGLEFARRVKADPETEAIPIVAVSAYAMPGDRQATLDAGCVDHITKPFSPSRLADQLGLSSIG